MVGRDDTLYARMKQRDLDGHESMWEPIFVDDTAIGLGDQKNRVRKTMSQVLYRAVHWCSSYKYHVLILTVHNISVTTSIS